jgi:tRNA A37 threonylcarbamoyladenosine modification protein TsaB
MSAKTFAFATGCVLLAIDTFRVIAEQAPPGTCALDVIADAQQEKVYVQRFVRAAPAGLWRAENSLSIVKLEEWLRSRDQNVWLSGPGLEVYGARLPAQTLMVPSRHWHPEPASLLELGLARYQAGENDDLWTLEPLYLRPSSAEEKWRARSGL